MSDLKSTVRAWITNSGFDLDPNLVLSICQVESNFRYQSARYEANFNYLFKADDYAKSQNITFDTEATFQKISWGIMQIMGGTARHLGFSGWLPTLSELEVGLFWSCRYLDNLCHKYSSLEDQIASYNAGSPRKLKDGKYLNQLYVDKVLGVYSKLGQL